ncbi:MAG TPA: hypothetical protein VMT20_01590 [Terriglobia bacterium]|nr:hypothetical protein [Terriglobia bacterium]
MGTKGVLTVADLETTTKPLEGGGYELDEGELVYVSPNSLEQWQIIHRCYEARFEGSSRIGGRGFGLE